jgi:L-iditol 2-dehydrogenase
MKFEIPKTMKACVLTGPNAFEIRDDVPVPIPGQDEVLCQIGGVAICGSDPGVFDGHLAGEWPPNYPFIAGHEWAGRVVAVGDNVTKFNIGDRVAGEAHKGCGHCRMCLEGRYTLCLNYGKPNEGHRHYGFTTFGAYAQYCVFHIKSCTALPDGISYKEAAMCDTGGVALHGVEIAGIIPGSTIAIIGPGPIGMMAMKLCMAMGAARIIIVGRGSRLESAYNLGCNDLVDFTKSDPVVAVRELTNGLGVDTCFECSGAKGSLSQAARMCRKGGCVVLLGVPYEERDESVPFKYIVHNEIMISGSRANPNVSWKLLNMIKNGRIYVKDLVTHTFSLDDMSKAMDTFVGRKENVMKVVIYPNGGEDV